MKIEKAKHPQTVRELAGRNENSVERHTTPDRTGVRPYRAIRRLTNLVFSQFCRTPRVGSNERFGGLRDG